MDLNDDGIYYVGCDTPKCLCNVFVSNHGFSSEVRAAKAWNRRAGDEV